MQCPQEHLKTIVYAKFGGQTKCIMGNSKIENSLDELLLLSRYLTHCHDLFSINIVFYSCPSQVGFAAAAPFVFKAISCPLAGITADLLRRNLLSTKSVRCLYYATGKKGWLVSNICNRYM